MSRRSPPGSGAPPRWPVRDRGAGRGAVPGAAGRTPVERVRSGAHRLRPALRRPDRGPPPPRPAAPLPRRPAPAPAPLPDRAGNPADPRPAAAGRGRRREGSARRADFGDLRRSPGRRLSPPPAGAGEADLHRGDGPADRRRAGAPDRVLRLRVVRPGPLARLAPHRGVEGPLAVRAAPGAVPRPRRPGAPGGRRGVRRAGGAAAGAGGLESGNPLRDQPLHDHRLLRRSGVRLGAGAPAGVGGGRRGGAGARPGPPPAAGEDRGARRRRPAGTRGGERRAASGDRLGAGGPPGGLLGQRGGRALPRGARPPAPAAPLPADADVLDVHRDARDDPGLPRPGGGASSRRARSPLRVPGH